MISFNKTQNGFTLIESLLTLFILAVGMLGVAGMQMQALRSGSVASQRMAVSLKTQEIIDRVRANTHVQDENLTEAQKLTEKMRILGNYSALAGANTACINGTVCTPDEIVAYDIYNWEQELSSILPGTPTSTITVNGSDITIDVTWQDRGDNYRYTVTSQI